MRRVSFIRRALRRARPVGPLPASVAGLSLAATGTTAAPEDVLTALDHEAVVEATDSTGGAKRVWAGATALVVVGVALRCWSPSHLWLDEALSVNIARLPLGDIPHALRHDGSPPLYYLLLHGWMRLFGAGDVAARSLSGVLSIAALPVMWFAGRRAGTRATAGAALILFASSPFAIRYATEARMYSLVMLLFLLGYLALARALERPTPSRLAAVSIVTGALLVSHYWAIYLVVLVLGLLVHRVRRGPCPVEARRAVLAVLAGTLLFLPWLPAFLYQLTHTGTPWATRPAVGAIVTAIDEFGGGRGEVAPISSLSLLALAALGVFARSLDHRRLEVDLRTRPRARGLALVAVGTLAVGVVAAMISGAAFAARYAALALPPFVLLAALGTDALADQKVRRWTLAVVAVLGLWTGARTSLHERTTAGEVAAAIEEKAAPGDVIAYCPDQLGPGVSRLLPDRFHQVTFPRGTRPERVDWVDYGTVNRAARAEPFAEMLLERAGAADIWMVWSPGYRTFGPKCEAIIGALEERRPNTSRVVRVKLRFTEHPGLIRFQALGSRPSLASRGATAPLPPP